MTADPFTLEIIGEMLKASAEEMFVTLQRTSQSPIIYEVLDCACALMSADGFLVAEAEGIPGFNGCLGFATRAILAKFRTDAMRAGDVYATNDPYAGGGTHLSDVVLIAPIIYEGQLVGFAANKAHWTEVGGMAAGSWTTDATEIFQEGLQFPEILLYCGGQAIDSLIDLIAANVRLPEMTLGDLYAGVASLRIGERGVLEICRRYGYAALCQTMTALLHRGEEVSLARLSELPAGIYTAQDWIDDDGLSDEPIPVQVKVTISAAEFVADFTGSAVQRRGPINTTRTGLHVAAREIFKAIIDPHFPTNEGLFRPLRIICPDGTLFTAQRPAPVSTYWESGIYVSDLIWRALFPIAPDKLTVGHSLSICGTIISGIDPERGPFVLVEPQAGGWGAGVDRDGESGLVVSGDGETYIMPVEVCEQRYPLLVDQFTFNVQHAGLGQFRGGYGLIRDYRVICDSVLLTASFGRHQFPPWGANGGEAGSPNAIEIIPDGQMEPVLRTGKVARYQLRQGDVARLITGSGGGYGDSALRSGDF